MSKLNKLPFLLVYLFFAPIASAATITVNQSGTGNYTNIPDAVANANDGDTIFLAAGTYNLTTSSNTSGAGGTYAVKVSREIKIIGLGTVNVDLNSGTVGFEIAGNNINFSNFIVNGVDNPPTSNQFAFYANGAGNQWDSCITQYQNITLDRVKVNTVKTFFSGVTNLTVINSNFTNSSEPIRGFNNCNVYVHDNSFNVSGRYDFNYYTTRNIVGTPNTWDLGSVAAAQNINISRLSAAPIGLPALAGTLGVYRNITATIVGTTAIVSIGYPQSAIDAAGVDESTLRLHHYNGTAWEALNSTVDMVANIVTGNTTAFSAFGIAGSSSVGSISSSSSASSHAPPPAPTPELADLNKVYLFFKTNTIVLYGSEVDRPVAEALARHFSPDAPLPVRNVETVTVQSNRNYVLVGGPSANKAVGELNRQLPLPFRKPLQGDKWSFSDGMGDQEAGAIQILDNPNDPMYKVMVVAGLTREGTRRAMGILTLPEQRMNGRHVMLN